MDIIFEFYRVILKSIKIGKFIYYNIKNRTIEMNVGIIVCTCGNTLNIDIDRIVEHAKSLEGVSIVKKVDIFCKNYKEVIQELKGRVDRVLFVGCSERSSLNFTEDKITQILEELGLDRAMFEVANIREQCAWIHEDKEEATRKALDLLEMAYVKLRTNRPTPQPIKLEKRVLVVGGGVAGLRCAIDLAKAGIEVVLVEKNSYLGGHTAQIPMLFQCEGYASMCTSECIVPVIAKEAMSYDNIKIITNAEVKEVEKVNGNFKVTIEQKPQFVDPDKCISCGKCAEVCPIEVPNQFDLGFSKRKAIDKDFSLAIPDSYNILDEHCNRCGECLNVCPTNAIDLDAKPTTYDFTFGAVAIATGFEGLDLSKISELNYAHPNVITSLEFERLLTKGFKRPSDGKTPESLVFVLCSGSRSENGGVPYCSKICCPVIMKLANRVATLYPETEITVVYRDIRTSGKAFEEFYRMVERKGVEFVRGEVEEISEENGNLKVVVFKEDGSEEEIQADLVVLAEALVPAGVQLLKKFGVLTDKFGFPIEFQPRIINPNETYVDRVFVVGAVKGPSIVQDSVEAGSAVAMRIINLLKDGEKRLQKFVSYVNKDLCSRCGMCASMCPHDAIRVKEDGAEVDAAFCRGCGLCMSVCPTHAIQLINFEDRQLLDQVEVAFKHAKPGEPKILALLCYWCSYAAADLMGIKGLKLPANFRSIRIRCSSSVNAGILLEILKKVDGVLIAGCPPKNCHHGWGNYVTAKRVKLMNEAMKQLGINPERLRWEFIGVAMWGQLAKAIKEMNERLRA